MLEDTADITGKSYATHLPEEEETKHYTGIHSTAKIYIEVG